MKFISFTNHIIWSKCSFDNSFSVIIMNEYRIISDSFNVLRTYAEYITPAALIAEELQCPVRDISCLCNASYQDIVVD